MERGTITLNDVAAFLVELAALALQAAWGFQTGGVVTKVALGLGLPALSVVLWGLFAAPRARYDVPVLKVVVTVLVLGGGALASFGVLPLGWAVAITALVVVTTAIRFVRGHRAVLVAD